MCKEQFAQTTFNGTSFYLSAGTSFVVRLADNKETDP